MNLDGAAGLICFALRAFCVACLGCSGPFELQVLMFIKDRNPGIRVDIGIGIALRRRILQLPNMGTISNVN